MSASQHVVEANGLRFLTMAEGPATGELFILLHGFPEGAESWSKQVSALARTGGLAVAPDMRGYGGSDAPAGVDSYSLTDLVEDVAAIIKAFGRDQAHIAGHDWGALVAWFFAGIHPEMTKTLTVLSVGVLAEDDFRRLRAMFGGAVPRAVVDRFVRSLSRPGRLTAALNYYRANLSRDNWWAGLRPDLRVTAPTVLLWGDQDPALGRLQAENTAKHMDSDFRLEVLEGAGHWLQFERADDVSRALVQVISK